MPRKPLTLPEVADRLGVHYMTVYRYVRTGRLPAKRVRGAWQVDPADLAHVERSRQGPRATGKAPSRARLEARLVASDEAGAWDVLEEALASGMEPDEVLLELIGPALHSIGTLWEQGKLSVADEHRGERRRRAAREQTRRPLRPPGSQAGNGGPRRRTRRAARIACLHCGQPAALEGIRRRRARSGHPRGSSRGDGGGRARPPGRRHRVHSSRITQSGAPSGRRSAPGRPQGASPPRRGRRRRCRPRPPTGCRRVHRRSCRRGRALRGGHRRSEVRALTPTRTVASSVRRRGRSVDRARRASRARPARRSRGVPKTPPRSTRGTGPRADGTRCSP